MVFVVDAVTRRVRRQPAGMSLVETLMAMVLLVFAFMLVFTLFHASLRYGLHVQQRVFADGLGLPIPLTDEITWLGAAIPSFLAGFSVQMLGVRTAAAVRLWPRLATGSE